MSKKNKSKWATQTELMTPDNPRWAEFIKRLEGPEGCNLRKDEKHGLVWTCDNTQNRPLARKILAAMGMNVEQSLGFFTAYAGHCDCEILFNVEGEICSQDDYDDYLFEEDSEDGCPDQGVN